MKRAFTLIEMLIVVAVLVTLMSMVFRLSSIGGDTTARNVTVSRLQRLENCLSGYYAAFGTYPPVKLHGTRDINREVSAHGIQTSTPKAVDWNNTAEAWKQVEAACRSQPVDVAFPFPDKYKVKVQSVAEALKMKAQSKRKEYSEYWEDESTFQKLTHDIGCADEDTIGMFSGKDRSAIEWDQVQVFKFGLMSYLLPRYLVMFHGSDSYFKDFAQWTDTNEIPAHPWSGKIGSGWQAIKEHGSAGNGCTWSTNAIASIPSQAVCARWMPNLEGVCSAEHDWTLFGVKISNSDMGNLDANNPNITVYVPGPADQDDSYNGQYVLDAITVRDGWYRELYYYSPSPHQSYVLWSAGPNGRTFPPWIPINTDNQAGHETISKWISDDIVNLSN